MYTVNEAKEPRTLEKIFQLRYKILRQPWNQPEDSSKDELEDRSINAYIANENGNVIACGRLQENEGRVGQIRYMAVEPALQGKGLGKKIVDFLETKAREKKLNCVQLQSRENAVKFYESQGYKVKEKTFLLWGLIQHYLMEKELDQISS